MRRRRKSLWTNTILSLGFSVFTGICVSLACIATFSAFTLFFMDSIQFTDFFGSASLFSGAFASGHICGKYRRRNGLAEGVLCGVTIYLLLFLAGATIGVGFPGLRRLLMLILSGAIGGVTGVNSKRPKSLTEP